ncbi:hypothetical protein IQ224_07930 [Microcystis sp. LEGE 00066]|nr:MULTISPECIES: hypothetical protein [Microcystis]TRU03465.1 MAG: hypothetical protein EWV61_08895 [Microcystis aeruginosa Ma_AC_P_19900807_S300]ARI79972.1 hypothetical protein BH695_0691 [Microcystis aeruginosa PCC 7806SL]ELS47034.1 hypothetical protein C789_3179 [Microcystis aeruginosa FACHB-905 = DIANCHI905]MBE9262142.1 hypothetical protein [Microcystis sp. LEGE 00066]UGS08406.1 hypothetical protein LRR78_19860 [Microcystis aeruginosa FACHB-905 = DIANCHI905]
MENLTINFPCPYLGGDVELTEERLQHIGKNHPDLLPSHLSEIAQTLANPQQIRRSSRLNNARLFSCWFDSIRQGKYVVVVVVSDLNPSRYWIITAYLARKLTGGQIEWQQT